MTLVWILQLILDTKTENKRFFDAAQASMLILHILADY